MKQHEQHESEDDDEIKKSSLENYPFKGFNDSCWSYGFMGIAGFLFYYLSRNVCM